MSERDVVERLRGGVTPHGGVDVDPAVLIAAADEIERLRAWIKAARDHRDTFKARQDALDNMLASVLQG
jgi:hypothetical protein